MEMNVLNTTPNQERWMVRRMNALGLCSTRWSNHLEEGCVIELLEEIKEPAIIADIDDFAGEID